MLAPPAMRPTVAISSPMSLLPTTTSHTSQLKRKPTLKRSIDETGSMEPPSSPPKRSRVAFDSDVEIVSADEEEDLDPAFVREQVHRAIQRHAHGDNETYEKIKTIFAARHSGRGSAQSTRVLRIYLQAVLSNISNLSKACNDLIHSVVSTEWVGRDDSFVELFTKFLGNLAAAQPGYLSVILRMLVDLLGVQLTRRVLGCRIVRQPHIHLRALRAMKYITQLIPSACGILAEAIQRTLTNEYAKPVERMTFIKNCMELVVYIPELTSDIITNITCELVKMDVSVQTELEEEDDDIEDEILHHVSSSQTLVAAASQDLLAAADDDDDGGITTDESDLDEDDEELDPQSQRRQRLRDGVQQVDLMMNILFHYWTNLMSSSSAQVRENAIDSIIKQFHKTILPTYRSRHAQFIVFHFAQFSPVIVDQFIASCIQVLLDNRKPQVIRHSAAAYFSGFVGRGAHVSPEVIRDCFDLLCDQLNLLRRTYDPICYGPDLNRFGDFYTTMQAMLYIFCFRWRDLATPLSDLDGDSDDSDNEIETFQFADRIRETFTSAIYSPLNPLRICTPVIVEQFAKITYATQFLYLHTKIEANRHVRLHSHWRGTTDMSINQPDRDFSWVGDDGILEGYFPYDPYELPISQHWIEADYVEWKGVPGEIKDDDSESEDDEDPELQMLEEIEANDTATDDE